MLSKFVSAALPVLVVCITALAETPEELVEQTYAVTANTKLTIRNTDGRIFVYGSEAIEIRIIALKRAFTKERLDGIAINVAVNSESATIDTVYPTVPNDSILADRSGTIDYTIIVPQYCTLSKVELANGEIIIEGMRGPQINARLGKGRLLFRNNFSPAQISVGRGGLDIAYGWWEDDGSSLVAAIAEGDLRLSLPADAGVSLDAASVNGRIRNRFTEDAEEAEEPKTLTTVLGYESGATFELRTTSGNIRIDKGD